MDLIIIGAIDIHTVLKTSLKPGISNLVKEFSERFSGSTLHIAVNASLLGTDVGIVSPVGRDAVGLLDVLRKYEVDYSHVVLSSEKSPNTIDLHTSTRHYTLYYPGVLQDFSVDNIDRAYLKKAKAVHICFPDQSVAEGTVEIARKEKVLTSVDTAFSSVNADIVFTEEKKKRPASFEGHIVQIDFGKHIICNKKKIPVFKDSPYYESGAKDAFIAGFLTRYIKSERPEHAALYGLCAAHWCSKTEKKVLDCTKKDVDSLFAKKLKESAFE